MMLRLRSRRTSEPKQLFLHVTSNLHAETTLITFRRQPCNVLPFVNKALALFQWKQDMPAAESLCQKALDIDPECDVAIATLAQLALQQGKIAEAIEWFERSGKLARTETELTTAITCELMGEGGNEGCELIGGFVNQMNTLLGRNWTSFK